MLRKLHFGVIGAVVVVAFSGCGSSADSVLDEQITTLKEMKVNFESIKDDASAEAALPKLDKAAAKSKELDEKVLSLKVQPDNKKLTDMVAAKQAAVLAAQGAMMKTKNKSKDVMDILLKMSSAKLPGM